MKRVIALPTGLVMALIMMISGASCKKTPTIKPTSAMKNNILLPVDDGTNTNINDGFYPKYKRN